MPKTQVQEYVAQLEAIQLALIEELTPLERAELKYETEMARWNTVRRVMLRFGDHLREHTTQLVAAREAAGDEQTMPQRMLARAQEAYGVLLGALVGLEDESLDAAPDPNEWSPRQVLEHMIATQQQYLEAIRCARQTARPVEKD